MLLDTLIIKSGRKGWGDTNAKGKKTLLYYNNKKDIHI